MSHKSLFKKIFQTLEQQGYQGRMISVEHLAELQTEIEQRYYQGEMAREVYDEEPCKKFEFTNPAALPEARSLIIAAAPQPPVEATFHVNGQPFPALIPPTYFFYTDASIHQLLDSVLGPEGYHLVKARLPLKLLAVRSGLAQYGRNNITYIPGMGSFHRPVAFYTDLPCETDSWGAAAFMPRCSTCQVCCKICPTGAITPDRFLIHAERCLTLHNESDRDFPEWIDPAWHNCIIGCLECQSSCPANKDVAARTDHKAQFSEEETALLLQGTPQEQLLPETQSKIKDLEIVEFGYFHLLPRNLRVLFQQQKILA
ncbi:iron-sulfur cluster-binding protein [Candidatus Vecturithrix granuli]|uniref:Iron-sulfur cluster-binding protein n=1 Tax=Vecturithrix granuli TaxID=1499967 RepID=A0A081C566_VECG1|nr:iron-sulfur cluster-binding protein [Candidatus Vecturithrix granuli]